MTRAVCHHCHVRPGRRACPALNAPLCGPCCSKLRMIELSCPEDCAFLRDARDHDGQRRGMAFVRHLVQTQHEALIQKIRNLEGLVFRFEEAIIRVQRGPFRSLTDRETLEGIQTAQSTIRTAGNGILYEHPANEPAAQAVSDSILKEIQSLREKLKEHGEELHLKNEMLVDFLEFVRMWVEFDKSEDPRSYLRGIALLHPLPKEESKLIVTP